MAGKRKIVIQVTEHKNYERFRSNDTYVTETPRKEIYIDFFEEYVNPISVMDRHEDDNEVEIIGVPDDDFHITRQKNVTVSIEKREAYYLATSILNKLKDDKEIIDLMKEEEEEEEEVGV